MDGGAAADTATKLQAEYDALLVKIEALRDKAKQENESKAKEKTERETKATADAEAKTRADTEAEARQQRAMEVDSI